MTVAGSVSVVVFDEAHRCRGDNKYMAVLAEFFLLAASRRPRILGLTASPFTAKSTAEVGSCSVH